MNSANADNLVQRQLKTANRRLGLKLKGDVFFLKAPMAQPIDDMVRAVVEEISPGRARRERLCVVFETSGGFIEVVERIVGIFRRNYRVVDFIVPNYAYSAGTVLVMSGDDIYMDYHSILGPIDPQYESEDGNYVPGMGYLAKFEELIGRINGASTLDEVRAEAMYLVERFDPAKLYHIEQAVEHSKSLLRDWLPKYKFKNWTVHETSGTPVSDADKQQRADEIAEILGNPDRWHSHGRGIPLRELESEEIKLKINNFGKVDELRRLIGDYYDLMIDYMGVRRWSVAMHTQKGMRRTM